MTQHGSLPAGEDRGHPMRLAAESRVANRVDALVQTMETTPTCPFRDRRAAHANAEQLLRGHHTMLLPRDGRDVRINGFDIGAFAHMGEQRRLVRGFRPPRGT